MNAHHDTPPGPTPRPSTGGLVARMLRAVAGAAAGVRTTRRGSFLVLVVGTLALMSVFAVVYIAIGRSDTSAAVGAQRNAARDNVPQQFADYVSNVIADDLFSRMYAGEEAPTTGTAPLVRRETFDHPSVDPDDTVATFTPAGNGTDPWLAPTMPTALHYTPTGAEEYEQYKDWLSISALAPDGMPVNLHNLRGNFDATPWDLRKDLKLIAANGTATTTTDFGQALPALSKSTPPWFYWSRQQGLFRPPPTTGPLPGSPDYLFNQYASADGSGLFDSRWFELRDDRDPAKPEESRNLLDAPSRLRYFFAARVIDLSSLVNVSTAGDSYRAPSGTIPVGFSPAEIDLRRILTLEDFEHQGGDSNGWAKTPDGTYAGLVQPADLGAVIGKPASDYSKYNDSSGARSVGDFAYNALRQILTEGYIPRSGTPMQGTAPFVFANAQVRRDFYTNFGTFEGGIATGGSGYRVGAAFSAEDLLDLFTYRGWNNPEITSSLERTLGGRMLASGVTPTQNYSVLRDNRPASLERDSVDINPVDGNADTKAMLAVYANARQYLTTISASRPLRSTIVGALTSGIADQLTDSELKVSLSAGPAATFRVYADALIPQVDDPSQPTLPGRWFGETKYNNRRTLNYGFTSAELGLQMAANMAVNLDHMIKWDGQPRAFTVLVHEDFRTKLESDYAGTGPATGKLPKTIKNRTYKQAWWVESTDTTGQLDLGQPNAADAARSRLATSTNGSKPVAAAFNVFGVHPEPVLTAAASFMMYTDAPVNANDLGTGGDTDGTGDPSVDPGEPVTINGSMAADNPDFIFQMVAFQLTNPYDTSINLTPTEAANDTGYDYYIEFGQRYYRVAKVDRNNPGQPLGDVSLAPHATRVFYATNMTINDAALRLRNVMRERGSSNYLPNWDDPNYAKAQIVRWINTQLAVRGHSPSDGNWADWEPVWIEPFSKTRAVTTPPTELKTGARGAKYVDGSGFMTGYDLLDGNPTTLKTVRLWRALRSQKGPTRTDRGEFNEKATDPLPEQFVENDMLVDRLHDFITTASTRPALDSHLRRASGAPWTGNRDVPGTAGFDESLDNEDNNGLSLVRYGLIRRPGDPRGGNLPIGGAPAYMMEAAYGNTLNALSPDYRRNGGGETDIDKVFFQNGGTDKKDPTNRSASTSMEKMLRNQTQGGPLSTAYSVVPYEAFRDEPDRWTNASIYVPLNQIRADFTKNRPMLPAQIPSNQARAADALLPLAVGPVQFIFDSTVNSGYPTDLDSSWLTTTEMLALAAGQDHLPGSKPYFAPLYSQFGPTKGVLPGGGAPVIDNTKTDRGNLYVDRFAPFYDQGGVPFPTIPQFDAAAGDYRSGLGIPPALAILDGFMSPEMSKYGSLSRGIPGLINVGTAPTPVLRTLPLLSPTTEPGAWWWTGGNLGVSADIAASLAAYRDKVQVRFRAGSGSPTTMGDKSANFDDTAGVKPNDLRRLDGRYESSDVIAVRERPGIRSVGEVMLARNLYDAAGNFRPEWANNIDFMGFATGNNHKLGVDSVLYNNQVSNMQAGGAGTQDGKIYTGRLAIANALMNSITNRSDLFAVWFVVHGYQRSDVEGLSAQDPMIPSVQRRFFMVVDRSEVIKKGQKPRIVLLREVPM